MDFAALIENHHSSELRDLHNIIFKRDATDAELKKNLIAFMGFSQENLQANLDYATRNFDAEKLISLCTLLQIPPAENVMEDGKAIIRKLTITKTPTTTEAKEQQQQTQQSRNTSTIFGAATTSSTVLSVEEQSIKVHAMKLKLIDLEEEQLEFEEDSREFVTLGKKISILSKRVSLEEARKIELLEEKRLSQEFSHRNPSNSNSSQDQDLRAMMIKTPQNLKLAEFDGTSCLDFHYFLLQYNSSTRKYKLTNDDNLLRLNDYIKGEARKKVDLLLKSSKDPSTIVRILQSHYGGEDRVLKEIIRKSNAIKKVTSLEQFKEFNCILQNISSVISEIDESIFDAQRLLSIYLGKLPDHFTTQWANFLMSKNLTLKSSNLNTFTHWIEKMSEVVTEVAFYNTVKEMNYGQETDGTETKSKIIRENKNIGSTTKHSTSTLNTSKKTCQICNQPEHPLSNCTGFKELEVPKRFATVKKLHYCIFCLNKHFGFCRKRKPCPVKDCTKYHHELLHQSDPPDDIQLCIQNKSAVLLKMLPVKLRVNNKISKVLAFLDDGSTLSLIDRTVADKLNLTGKSESISFQWTGDIYREDKTSQNLSLELCGENSDEFFKVENIHSIDDLKLPKQRVSIKKLLELYPDLSNVNVSESYEGTPVLLLGQDHANLITNRQTVEIPNGGPCVSKTKLGWAVHGPVNISGKNFKGVVSCITNEDSLEKMVNNQYKLENFDLGVNQNDFENVKVVELAKNSIKKVNDHYEICLPWKENVTQLPNSLPLAKSRLLHLEKSLLKDKLLLNSYKAQIDKLLEKQYAKKISFSDLKGKSKYWILPHFPVFNPKKPKKPARIVFDAAAKVQKFSLNDFLHAGPDWLCSILGILIRFRKNKIGFTGDICEMFNRVKIQEEDTFAQCFLWRDSNPKKPIELYKMDAMLFGLNCAPFLAQFVKNFNAEQYQENFPDAFHAITKNHYMDDFVDSKDNLEEAVKLITDVIQVHKNGGFHIRSFISNDTKLIQQLPKELVADDMFKNDPTENIQKVLGLFWDTKGDKFHFLFNFVNCKPEVMSGKAMPSKKEVLQILMSIFDPLGLLSPVTVKGKILMQLLWKSKIGWTDIIPKEYYSKWISWLQEIKQLKDIQIPRCYRGQIDVPEDVQLHIFCDASADSYCATAYLRFKEKTTVEVSLVFAKSRVAPISKNSMTIPKLELTGAVLGIRIANLIKENIAVQNTFFWTDSMVVLAWINSKKFLKIFEKNRVDEILRHSKPDNWSWIPTKENVADLGTRDNTKNITNDSRWFCGPEFLYDKVSSWNNYFKNSASIHQNSNPENENVCMIIVENAYIRKKLILPDIERFNNYFDLLKVTAWLIRYKANLKANCMDGTPKTKLYVDIFEIKEATKLWVRKVQQDCFKEDINRIFQLSNGSKSRLSRYSYQLDDDNVLRLHGRIRANKYLPNNVVNPIILDGDHKFTKLLILDIHERFEHFGTQAQIHEFKDNYWMPKLTSKFKRALTFCVKCRINNPQPINPPIGDLIRERFRFFEKAFTAVGIDYFGPFHVKNKKTVSLRYGVLFTCLTTRATHVEIAHTLNTDSCIMAIRRMMARRGQIRLLKSDNASNFKGASSELRKCLELLHPEEIGKELVKYGIEWQFIPVQTPHFGGCWERIIGCFKRAISSVLPTNRYLTDEMLQTVFIQTEYVMNCRPYILESDDPDDSITLTPMDILVPKFIEVDSVGTISDIPIRKRQWRVCESLVDSFWNRFLKEYVPTILNNKLRKFSDEITIEVGDLVYIKNRAERCKWPIGKIEKVIPGRDNNVRIVEVLFNGNREKISVRNLLKINLNNNVL